VAPLSFLLSKTTSTPSNKCFHRLVEPPHFRSPSKKIHERICTFCCERKADVYADVHDTCLTYTPAHAWCSQHLSKMHTYSPQKMHMNSCMRAYANAQKLLCHGRYCKLILSLARVSCRLSFAARSCRPSCCLDQIRRPTLFAQEIRPNPKHLMTRSPLLCRTSIILSSAMVQASSSLSMGRTRAWLRGSLHQEFYFHHFLARILIDMSSRTTQLRVSCAFHVAFYSSSPPGRF